MINQFVLFVENLDFLTDPATRQRVDAGTCSRCFSVFFSANVEGRESMRNLDRLSWKDHVGFVVPPFLEVSGGEKVGLVDLHSLVVWLVVAA